MCITISGTGGASAGTGGSDGTGTGGSGGTGELPFLIGADITHTMEDEYWNAQYFDGGGAEPLEVILKRHGFNAARIDTFVNPSAPGGYAEGAPAATSFRSLAQTITLAKRVKAAGMYFLLDLHMSDTWTNPSNQATPNDWDDSSLVALQSDVYDYVHGAVTDLVNQGARPDLVQVGNEITNGMLWPTGQIDDSDFSNFGALLKSGIQAVRDVDSSILVMLHIEKCNNLNTTRWWLDGVLDEGVSFDVFAQSCYAPAGEHAGYQGSPSEWGPVFDTIASEYPGLDFAIAEYSASQVEANDVILAISGERGLGTFNWDPTRAYETHPNVPLFDMDWPNFTVNAEMAKYATIVSNVAAAGR